MEKGSSRKYYLLEANNSLNKSKKWKELGNIGKYINNLILTAALYKEAGELDKTKGILKTIININETSNKLKKDLEEALNTL